MLMTYFSLASYRLSSPVYIRRPMSNLSSFVYFTISLLSASGFLLYRDVLLHVPIMSYLLYNLYPLRVHF